MEAITDVTVNGRTYKVTMFDPMTAFSFIHSRIHAAVYGTNQVGLAKIAICQCITPTTRPLNDDAVFQEWFSQYPEDMLPLEARAIEALEAPFDPKIVDITPEAKNDN